jgi:hypothetical protein
MQFYSLQITETKGDMQCTYKRNTEARSCNHICRRKEISITYVFLVCVCKSNLWTVWLLHIFPHYFINGMVFGGKRY